MPDTKDGLYAALAKVQAELKPIKRNVEGQVGNRKRKYADLAAVSEKVLPLLGKNGLSFTARPTLNEGGHFVLAYSLLHSSGAREDGEYPLPGGKAQDVGSAITYARRYALCAVTGAAPEGEDDDGEEAQKDPQGDWRDQSPVQPRQHRTPTKADLQQANPGLGDWAQVINGVDSAEAAAKAKADLDDVYSRGNMAKPKYDAIARALTIKGAKYQQRVKTAHQDPEHQRLVESAEDRATHKPAERLRAVPEDDEWNAPLPEEPADAS